VLCSYIAPYTDTHETVVLFWKMMESFTNVRGARRSATVSICLGFCRLTAPRRFPSLCRQEERVLFLRFAWGRTRLPAGGRWGKERPFKLSRLTKQGVNDSTLPIAHACFNNVELPQYSTYAIMRQRMLIAMHYGCGFFGIM
jgi:hypothetical protein